MSKYGTLALALVFVASIAFAQEARERPERPERERPQAAPTQQAAPPPAPAPAQAVHRSDGGAQYPGWPTASERRYPPPSRRPPPGARPVWRQSGYYAPALGFYGFVPLYGGYPYYTDNLGYHVGGIKFKNCPRDADVWINGGFAGIVDQYDGLFDRLAMPPGTHHVLLKSKDAERALNVYIPPGNVTLLVRCLPIVPVR